MKLSEDTLTLLKVDNSDINEDGSFKIPNSVITIGREAFQGCADLTALTLNKNLTHIGRSSFKGCTGLTTFTLNENLTHIGAWAFDGCIGLTALTLNKNFTHIGDAAFSGCTGLTALTLNKNLTHIGEMAFKGCIGLTALTLNKKLTHISLFAFSGCAGLTTITLNENLTHISGSVFYGCTGLTALTLNENLTHIGSWAFYGCPRLESIVIDTKDESKLNRIKTLLPKNLQSKAVSIVIYNKAKTALENSFKKLLNNPKASRVYDIVYEVGLCEDVLTIINQYDAENIPCYQEMRRLPRPKNEAELKSYINFLNDITPGTKKLRAYINELITNDTKFYLPRFTLSFPSNQSAYSSSTKIAATKKIISHVNDQITYFSKDELLALSDGSLGVIIKDLKIDLTVLLREEVREEEISALEL